MFTSRAEFRLHLRIDNADERLTPMGRQLGIVDDRRWQAFSHKQTQKRSIMELLQARRTREAAQETGVSGSDDNPVLAVWLRRPEAKIEMIRSWIARETGSEPVHGVLSSIETELKYSGYISQQERQMERLEAAQGRRIPEEFKYAGIPGLSLEIIQKLNRVRPQTLGQAQRVPGVTPAAIAVLDVYLTLHAGAAEVRA